MWRNSKGCKNPATTQTSQASRADNPIPSHSMATTTQSARGELSKLRAAGLQVILFFLPETVSTHPDKAVKRWQQIEVQPAVVDKDTTEPEKISCVPTWVPKSALATRLVRRQELERWRWSRWVVKLCSSSTVKGVDNIPHALPPVSSTLYTAFRYLVYVQQQYRSSSGVSTPETTK